MHLIEIFESFKAVAFKISSCRIDYISFEKRLQKHILSDCKICQRLT